ncbi:MAG: hypothetical protein ABI346_04645 [Candidatus Baltobacteraceae bacterium]
MAGRGSGVGPIELGVTLATAARLAGAIALDTLALIVWNVGTRAPLEALRDLRAALGRPRAIVAGSLSLLVGLVFVAASTVLLFGTLDDVFSEFVPIEIFAFLVALVLEYLIGSEIRGGFVRLGGRSRR